MKEDKFYLKLKEKMDLVFSVPPQNLGVFTPYWKKVIPIVKKVPFPLLTLTGLVSTIILWLLLGTLLVQLVTILQNGF